MLVASSSNNIRSSHVISTVLYGDSHRQTHVTDLTLTPPFRSFGPSAAGLKLPKETLKISASFGPFSKVAASTWQQNPAKSHSIPPAISRRGMDRRLSPKKQQQLQVYQVPRNHPGFSGTIMASSNQNCFLNKKSYL